MECSVNVAGIFMPGVWVVVDMSDASQHCVCMGASHNAFDSFAAHMVDFLVEASPHSESTLDAECESVAGISVPRCTALHWHHWSLGFSVLSNLAEHAPIQDGLHSQVSSDNVYFLSCGLLRLSFALLTVYRVLRDDVECQIGPPLSKPNGGEH